MLCLDFSLVDSKIIALFMLLKQKQENKKEVSEFDQKNPADPCEPTGNFQNLI
jgi:hypothetical protein